MKDKTTLFVCSGNTCRSQMAEALARHLFASSKFISAGTKAIANQPTSRHAVTLLLERGIAWQGVSQRLSSELLLNSDLVLVMTEQHQQSVETILAQINHPNIQVERLSAAMDIADPYGESLDSYRRCMDNLELALKQRFKS
jgi:protein-tyrosine-phosphatase